MDFDPGEVEQLLGELGGFFPLETFLRHIARIKGFQALGPDRQVAQRARRDCRRPQKGMQVEMIKQAEYYVFVLADGGSTQMPFSPPVGIKQWQCAACGHRTEVIQAFATAVAAAEAAA